MITSSHSRIEPRAAALRLSANEGRAVVAVIVVVAAVLMLGSMVKEFCHRKTPFLKYLDNSYNPLVLVFTWPYWIFKLVRWCIRGRREIKDLEAQEAAYQANLQAQAQAQNHAIGVEMQNMGDQGTSGTQMDHMGLGTQYPPARPLTHSPFKTYSTAPSVASIAPSSLRGSLGFGASQTNYVPQARVTANAPPKIPYVTLETNIIGRENASYFDDHPASPKAPETMSQAKKEDDFQATTVSAQSTLRMSMSSTAVSPPTPRGSVVVTGDLVLPYEMAK